MAKKRMFAISIVDSDSFLDMPLSAQALYFHLGMRADDDGFINNPKGILRAISCNEDDLKLLITKNFVICFDSGIIVITHWKQHNTIQNDRYTPTNYKYEFEQLQSIDKTYSLQNKIAMDTECIQTVSKMDTQYRLDKIRVDKSNIYCPAKQDSPSFLSEIKEIVSYLNEKTGSNFKHSTKDTQKHINARLKEGYTVEDFKKVIDIKVREWLSDTKMSQYLRPATLFGTKFENYLNQATTTPTKKIYNENGGF